MKSSEFVQSLDQQKIIDAIATGRSELVITTQAKLAAKFHSMCSSTADSAPNEPRLSPNTSNKGRRPGGIRDHTA